MFLLVIQDNFLFEIMCSQNILINILIILYYLEVILHGRKSGVW